MGLVILQWGLCLTAISMSPQAAINVLLSVLDRKGPQQAGPGAHLCPQVGTGGPGRGGAPMRPIICICNDPVSGGRGLG